MSTQPIAILITLGFGLIFLFIVWSALAVSSREEEDQQRWLDTMAAIGRQEWPAPSTYPDDPTEHNDA